MRYRCTICKQGYSSDLPLQGRPVCSNGGLHKPKPMAVRDEYQAILDDLGIPEDDPLRSAE